MYQARRVHVPQMQYLMSMHPGLSLFRQCTKHVVCMCPQMQYVAAHNRQLAARVAEAEKHKALLYQQVLTMRAHLNAAVADNLRIQGELAGLHKRFQVSYS